jgi:hypothetical protein
VTGRRVELWLVLLVGSCWAIVGLHRIFTDRTQIGLTLLAAACLTWLGLLTCPPPDDRRAVEEDE